MPKEQLDSIKQQNVSTLAAYLEINGRAFFKESVLALPPIYFMAANRLYDVSYLLVQEEENLCMFQSESELKTIRVWWYGVRESHNRQVVIVLKDGTELFYRE